MEKKIQELKTKLLNDLEMFMHNSIEQFTTLLSDISNEYLVKTKERELELKDEVDTLKKEKEEITVYINEAKDSAKDFTDKMEQLKIREIKLECDNKHLAKIKEEVSADLNMVDTMKAEVKKEKDAFEKEKQQFQVQKAMVEEQVKTLRKLNI